MIFGGSGDLARRRLIPALYNLLLDGLLPAKYRRHRIGPKTPQRSGFSSDLAREGVIAHSRQPLVEATWREFEQHFFYLSGENEDAHTYSALKARAEEIERTCNCPAIGFFISASRPVPSPLCAKDWIMRAWRRRASGGPPYSRIIVEKPVGRDLASARHINEVMGRVFDESQIFRIDHYLGKETVQNLMVIRFANSIFEPIWNNKYIDHVQITVCEAEGLGSRAAYYEEAGALRDMIQNHMLQLQCLVAMEPPYSLEPDVVRNAKMEVLRCLRPIIGADVEQFTVRAQYAEGIANGKPVKGYRLEKGVDSEFNDGNLRCAQMRSSRTGAGRECRSIFGPEKRCPSAPAKLPCSSKTFLTFFSIWIRTIPCRPMSWCFESNRTRGFPFASSPAFPAPELKPIRSTWIFTTARYSVALLRKPMNDCCWT